VELHCWNFIVEQSSARWSQRATVDVLLLMNHENRKVCDQRPISGVQMTPDRHPLKFSYRTMHFQSAQQALTSHLNITDIIPPRFPQSQVNNRIGARLQTSIRHLKGPYGIEQTLPLTKCFLAPVVSNFLYHTPKHYATLFADSAVLAF
jgi:hypothetical protein